MQSPDRPVDVSSRRSLASIVWVVVAMVCAFAVTPAAAGAATEWTPGPSFGADTNISVSPLVVGDAAGGVTAAWGIDGSSSSRAKVVAQHIAADGTRGPLLQLGFTQWPGEFTLDRPEHYVTVGLRLVPTASGAVVAWQDPGAADPNSRTIDFKFARIGSDGTAGPATTVATGLTESEGPTLAPGLSANAAGDVLSSWWTAAGDAHVQRFAADGSVGPDVTLPSAKGPDYALPVALQADGTGRVAYTSSTNTLLAARITPGGTLDGAPVTVSTAGKKLHGPPLMASSSGGVVVTWGEADTENGTPPLTLRSALLPGSGAVASPGRMLIETLAMYSSPADLPGVAVAITPSGTVMNAWSVTTLDSQGKQSTSIVLATLAPNAVGPTLQPLSGPDVAPTGTSANLPRFAAAPNGAVVVAWIQIDSALLTTPVATVDLIQNAYRVRAMTIGVDGTFGPVKPASLLHLLSLTNLPFDAGVSGGRSMASWTEVGGNGTVINTALETPVVVPTPSPTPTPAPAAAAPAPAPAPAAPAPKLSLVSFSKTSIVPGDKALFVLTLSTPGTVKIAISKPTSGRKSAGKCVPQTKKNKKKAKCTFDKAVTTITQAHAAGRTTILFNGKIGNKKLAVGSYKATITLTSSTGVVSPPTVLTFKVKAKRAATKG